MTLHDACTSGTSLVLTIVSLQRLEMETLIPAPADYELRSVIKILNTQSIAPIEIHCHLCQVYGHTRLDIQHASCRILAGRCLSIIYPISRTSHIVISIFSYTSRNSCPASISIFKMTERQRRVTQWFQSQELPWWSSGYHTHLWIRGSWVRFRPGSMDFFRA